MHWCQTQLCYECITGQNSDGNGLSEEEKRFNKPTQGLLWLIQSLVGSNRSVTFNNWFSSIEFREAMEQRELTKLYWCSEEEYKRNTCLFLTNKKTWSKKNPYSSTKDITLVSYTTKINKTVSFCYNLSIAISV